MSLELFGYKSVREKVEQEKKWLFNHFADCPLHYDPEADWKKNAVICRLSVLKPYCEHFGIFQILNREFNNALAAEIHKLGLNPVLEVGAGCGELADALNARGIDILAVDDYTEPLPDRCKNKAVLPKKMDYMEALKLFQPQLIICSWIPDGNDWTVDFRAMDSVKAYILIGEDDKVSPQVPGWAGKVLKEPNKWSLCRMDNGVDFERPELWWRHSKVVLFQREAVN